MKKCSYPPCDKPAVTTFPMESGETGHLCAEHTRRTEVVNLRLAGMTEAEVFAYFDGLIDAQPRMTENDRRIMRERLRAKYRKDNA